MPNNQIKSLTIQGVTYDIVDKTSGYLTSSSNLDATKLTGTVPTASLPSYVDDVLEYSSQSGFPSTGETGKIYVDTGTNLTYRWGGSSYVEISPSLALGETSSTAYRGDYGASAYAHAVTNKGSAFSSGLYKITTNAEGHVTAATAVQKSDITGLGIPAQDTTYTFDGTYNSSTNKVATVSTVTNAIEALDGGTIGTPSASKTLTALSQTNGNISATFSDISIANTQVSGLGTASVKNVTDNSSNTAVTSSDTNLITGRTLYYHLANEGYAKSTDLSNYLSKTNTTSYTPSADYHPSTKKYVDDAIGSISTSLAGLSDTTVTSPTNGQILLYNTTSSKWENGTIPHDSSKQDVLTFGDNLNFSNGTVSAEDQHFVITITSSTSNDVTTYSSNKTYIEINNAYVADKKLYVIYNNQIYEMNSYDSSLNRFYFVRTYYNNGTFFEQITINSSNVVSFTSKELVQDSAMYQYVQNPSIGYDNSYSGTYGTTARRSYAIGDLFWYGEHQLGRATAAISYGDTLTLNTNYVTTTISDEFKRMPTIINNLIDTALAEYDNGDLLSYGNVEEEEQS